MPVFFEFYRGLMYMNFGWFPREKWIGFKFFAHHFSGTYPYIAAKKFPV
jgi:hypothetical protein